MSDFVTSVRVDQQDGAPHAHVTVWIHGANVGTLCVRSDEVEGLLQLLRRKPAAWVGWRAMPVCGACWEARHPDRPAVSVVGGSEERCVECEERTTSGIYVRMRVEW